MAQTTYKVRFTQDIMGHTAGEETELTAEDYNRYLTAGVVVGIHDFTSNANVVDVEQQVRKAPENRLRRATRR